MSKHSGRTATSYRSFGIHVKLVTTSVCTVELLVILLFVLASLDYPLMSCRAVNSTLVVESVDRHYHDPMGLEQLAAPMGGPRSRPLLDIRRDEGKEVICSSHSLLICFAAFHALCDLVTLMSMVVERDRLVLPLLLILVLNMLVSLLFIASALTAYGMSGRVAEHKYGMVFLAFIVCQAAFRLYEFHCARQLYWYYQDSAVESTMDTTHGSFSLLRKDSETRSYHSTQ